MAEAKKSQLVPAGLIFIVLAVVGAGPIAQNARGLEPGTLRGVLLITSDLVRLLFFVGIGCLIIGALRNRKAKAAAINPPKETQTL